MAHPTTPGIYQIRNRVTGESYVGASRNLAARISGHIHLIQQGRHPVPRINELTAAHGAGSFEAHVLERCAEADLNAREWHWSRQILPSLSRLPPAAEPGQWDRKAPQKNRRPTRRREVIPEPSRGLSREKLRARRAELGMTQEDVASAANMPISTYARIESGLNDNPRCQTAARIANALQCLINDLLVHPFVPDLLDKSPNPAKAGGE